MWCRVWYRNVGFFGMFGCGAGVCRAVMQKSSANEVSTDLIVPRDTPPETHATVGMNSGASRGARRSGGRVSMAGGF
jgi:hypothetical protein